MTALPTRNRAPLHPLHAILLAFPVAFFTGALAADATYLNTAEMQWSNFAAWMIVGALLFGAPVVGWAAVSTLRGRGAGRRIPAASYLVVVLLMWLTGLVNAFQHSRDGWSSVGTAGLLLSMASTLLALVAGWIGYSGTERREYRA